jgi:para-nitrobenzyl esterase
MRTPFVRATLVACLGFLLPSCDDSAGLADLATSTDAATSDLASAPDAACAPAVSSDPDVIITDRGAVSGVLAGGTYAWKGIPYAAPPVGDLRWRAPQPAACWSGVRDASGFGYECMQLDENGTPVGSEDCLTLNVWAPATSSAPLPVLVYLHGGYNQRGTSSLRISGQDVYDGSYLSAHGPAVVVTINYRLGPLGFLAHPTLAAEDAHGSSGNYAILDQIAALTWVQHNIAAFGGDPAWVMLFGQSAGAIDTCTLVASPLAAGLFSRAIMHSGNCSALPRSAAEQAATSFAQAIGCDAAADVPSCLRSKSAPEAILARPETYAPGGLVYNQNVDGYVLPDDPGNLIVAGKHNHVPILIGNTSYEFSTLLHDFFPAGITDETTYEAAAHTLFGLAIGDAVLARYPASSYASPLDAFIHAVTDAYFVCVNRRIARALSAVQTEPVRRFDYSHVFDDEPMRVYGAGHGYDVLFAFHNLDFNLTGYAITPAELSLSDEMVGYWTRFAATGDPNGGGAPAWPAYDPTIDPYLQLDETTAAAAGDRTAFCDFWDSAV